MLKNLNLTSERKQILREQYKKIQLSKKGRPDMRFKINKEIFGDTVLI
jgi:hypothetical protein